MTDRLEPWYTSSMAKKQTSGTNKATTGTKAMAKTSVGTKGAKPAREVELIDPPPFIRVEPAKDGELVKAGTGSAEDSGKKKWWAETGFQTRPVYLILREMSALLRLAIKHNIDGLLWMPEFVHRAWWLTEQIGECLPRWEGVKAERDWLSLKEDTAQYIARYCTDELPVLDGELNLDDERDEECYAACCDEMPTMSDEIRNELREPLEPDQDGFHVTLAVQGYYERCQKVAWYDYIHHHLSQFDRSNGRSYFTDLYHGEHSKTDDQDPFWPYYLHFTPIAPPPPNHPPSSPPPAQFTPAKQSPKTPEKVEEAKRFLEQLRRRHEAETEEIRKRQLLYPRFLADFERYLAKEETREGDSNPQEPSSQPEAAYGIEAGEAFGRVTVTKPGAELVWTGGQFSKDHGLPDRLTLKFKMKKAWEAFAAIFKAVGNEDDGWVDVGKTISTELGRVLQSRAYGTDNHDARFFMDVALEKRGLGENGSKWRLRPEGNDLDTSTFQKLPVREKLEVAIKAKQNLSGLALGT